MLQSHSRFTSFLLVLIILALASCLATAGSGADHVAVRQFTTTLAWRDINAAMVNEGWTLLEQEPGMMAVERYSPVMVTRSVYYDFSIPLRIAVEIERTQGADPRVSLRADRFAGDSTGGRFSALPDAWTPVRRGDTEEALIESLARAIAGWRRESTPAAPIAREQESTWRAPWEQDPSGPIRLAGNRVGICRGAAYAGSDANTVELTWILVDRVETPGWCALDPDERARLGTNTAVYENPADARSGTRITACTTWRLRAGWRPVEWYRDPARCPEDPSSPHGSTPNVMVVERMR